MPASSFHLEWSPRNRAIGWAAATALPAAGWALGLRTRASIYARLQTPLAEPFDAAVR